MSESIFCPNCDIVSLLLNPLDIPYVLENVFEYLSVFNLKKCRLVSKTWVQEATPILQKRCKITFKSEQQLNHLLTLDNLGTFCQTFDISHDFSLYNPTIQNFFNKFSSIVKSLDLSLHHEFGSIWIQEIFPSLILLEELCLNGRAAFLNQKIGDLTCSNVFKNLQFLFVYDSSYELEGPIRQRIWAENIFQIIFQASHLERVFFAPFLETRAKTFFSLITSDALLKRNVSHLHINHLSMARPEIDILLRKQFPIKYLHIVLTNNLSKEYLNILLQKLQKTLRELTITFTDGVTCTQFHPMEPFNQLTKLSLIGYEGPLITSSAKNLQLFVMSLPEPDEELKLPSAADLRSKGLRLNRELKELEIYDSKGKYYSGNLKLLYNHFSSLKSLKMNNVDNFILRLVYTHLPNLSELHICFHKFYGVSSLNIDSGLNGIPEFRQEEYLLDCIDAKDIDHVRTYPWIGWLKNLKLLELELGHLTDFGVILGIVRCSTVRKLVLKNRECFDDTNLTDRSLIAICDFMTLTYLKLEGYNECFSDDAITETQKKMEGIETYFI